jgi:hypothetical protein
MPKSLTTGPHNRHTRLTASDTDHTRPVTAYPLPSNVTGTAAVFELLATQRFRPAQQACTGVISKDDLEEVLRHMTNNRTPELFLGQYLLMRERSFGGQALVQFARSRDGSFFQYAIKCAALPMHACLA